MAKIQLMTDSACDLDPKAAKKYGIRVLSCHVDTAEGSYDDGKDFTADDVYSFVERTGDLPTTSQVTMIEWMDAYREAAQAGADDIIVVTMNAQGSGTYAAACQAATMFPEEEPELAKSLTIRVLDSTGYSAPISMALQKAAALIENGASAREAAAFLEDWYAHQTTLLGLGSLQYAKRSGRLNTVAAFVGEVLGLKPIMSLHTTNQVIDKSRGMPAMIDKLAHLYMEKAADPENGDYALVYGTNRDEAKQLVAAIRKLGGPAPAVIRPIGTCIAINTGPKMLGIGFYGKDGAN